ncbi:MAG: phosphate signaling complex protein PhoU [Actinobacteria bacterium]|nr:phosphate signaling complex protein PhoU [Actinomycetota bacterium]
MRETFHRELEKLDQDVVRMGALVEAAIEQATLALAECDLDRAQKVMDGDDAIDDLFLDIEKRALSMLAQQQPVAGDLRLIVAILRAVNDLERSGDLAFNIASVVKKDIDIVKLRKVSALVYELGHASRRLLSRALDAWTDKDVVVAASLDDLDDEIDELYERLFRELFALQNETSFEVAMNLVLVGRYFERIADHAVNLAERIRYFVTGDEEHLG